jgi:hypothetical protein
MLEITVTISITCYRFRGERKGKLSSPLLPCSLAFRLAKMWLWAFKSE